MKTDALHLASFCTSRHGLLQYMSWLLLLMSVLLSFLLFYLWRKIVFKMNIRYSRRRCLLLKHLQQHHHHHHDIHVIKMNENCLSKHLKNINCFHIPINFISLRDQLKNPKFNRGKTINTRKNMPNDDFIEATIVKKAFFRILIWNVICCFICVIIFR